MAAADTDRDSSSSVTDWERVEERRLLEDEGGQAFVVDVDGFEGPLDLMLALARAHKIDLAHISVLYLAEQYLRFIETARQLRLDLAADYLVMAAWLTYLKSKLLLPDEPAVDEEPSATELAEQLANRLRRLEAMRKASGQLIQSPQLGVDFFACGNPEGITTVRKNRFEADIYDLLAAYASGRLRKVSRGQRPVMPRRRIWSIKEAWAHLERLIGSDCRWAPIDALLAEFLADPQQGRSALATGFGASLEMAKSGQVELRQSGTFEPLYLRRKENKK